MFRKSTLSTYQNIKHSGPCRRVDVLGVDLPQSTSRGSSFQLDTVYIISCKSDWWRTGLKGYSHLRHLWHINRCWSYLWDPYLSREQGPLTTICAAAAQNGEMAAHVCLPVLFIPVCSEQPRQRWGQGIPVPERSLGPPFLFMITPLRTAFRAERMVHISHIRYYLRFCIST